MLSKMEREITKGRDGGKPSEDLDSLMQQITSTSSRILQGRQEILAGQHVETRGESYLPVKEEDKKKESGKERRNRLRAEKKSKKKAEFSEAYERNKGAVNEGQAEQRILEKDNRHFEQYYRDGLKIVPDAEWDQFYNMLKEPLDVCFRVNSIDKHYQRTLN